VPRYKYNCTACEEIVTIFHTLDEIYSDCEQCGCTGSMARLLSKPFIIKQQTDSNRTQVGELTKKYIKENRELLKQEKEELRKKTHEPS